MEFNREKALAGLAIYKARANEALSIAGYTGAQHDGGSGKMFARIEAYQAGLDMVIPDWLEDVIAESERKECNERAEYQRLKKKYESS